MNFKNLTVVKQDPNLRHNRNGIQYELYITSRFKLIWYEQLFDLFQTSIFF